MVARLTLFFLFPGKIKISQHCQLDHLMNEQNSKLASLFFVKKNELTIQEIPPSEEQCGQEVCLFVCLFVLSISLFQIPVFPLGMAMRLRHMQNDVDNAHICGNIRDYLRVCGYAHRFALMRIGEFWRMAIPSFHIWRSIGGKEVSLFICLFIAFLFCICVLYLFSAFLCFGY